MREFYKDKTRGLDILIKSFCLICRCRLLVPLYMQDEKASDLYSMYIKLYVAIFIFVRHDLTNFTRQLSHKLMKITRFLEQGTCFNLRISIQ